MALLLLPRLFVGLFGWAHTYTEAEAPPVRWSSSLGRVSPVTAKPPPSQDRTQTAARLYFAGKAAKLLMTGDNSTIHYNEPEAMRRYALSLGVPDADIVLDYAGRRTYDSCYRACAIFGVRQAILVTQISTFRVRSTCATCSASKRRRASGELPLPPRFAALLERPRTGCHPDGAD